MPSPKALRLLLCMLTLPLVVGCHTPCLDLANQICQCQPDTTSQGNCQTNAQNAEATFSVRGQDDAFCQQKLDEGVCDCNRLDTLQGRINCGLAYPTVSPDGGTPDAGTD
jgi:hypothetical protein